jgi:hypothetical protein
MNKRCIEFTRRPSAVGYMLRLLYPGALRGPPPFPPLRVRWRASSADSVRLQRFLDQTGLDARDGVPLLYPQVATYPLQMAILTDCSMPLPIWKVLQVRNHVLQHRRIPPDAALDTEASIVSERVLAKALELDLHVSVRVRGELAWEGITTYYYRGRYGVPQGPSSLLTAPPTVSGEAFASWSTHRGGGLTFSGLSGDYNGIHYWSAYARLFGFRGAFHHPHLLVGQSLARLSAPSAESQRLDLWFKGPVYYGSKVGLAAREVDDGVAFSLTASGSKRAAFLGRWSGVAPGTPLLDTLRSSAA